MATPEAMTTQLDSLVASVEAMRDAQREIDAMVGVPADPTGALAEVERFEAGAVPDAVDAAEGTGSGRAGRARSRG
jgi:hypothetical protein